uniref:PCI domain-containing protein 2 homolog n=1 Tax=Heterorhabditis bacteriophora TaxID=37862 RepID=A0A1I7XVG6_HETBA
MADELTDKDDEVENVSSFYEQCANYIMEAYRTCTSDVRESIYSYLKAYYIFLFFYLRSTIMGGNLIPLSAFLTVLHYLGVNDVDADELECIVANLIADNQVFFFQKKIKGYISHQHQKLVISKKDPFPALSSVHA